MAVRLPKDFQMHSDEVEIIQVEGGILIREIPKNLAGAFSLFQALPKDFFSEGRTDPFPQERDGL